MAVEVEIYLAPNGKAPFSVWLSKLRDAQGRAVIKARINRLRVGNFGDCKPIGGGMSELRIDFGPGYRVYFGQAGKAVIVLLCGGDKGSQPADIRKAKAYWAEYQAAIKQEAATKQEKDRHEDSY